MKRLEISAGVDRKFPVGVGGIANSDILKSYLGLLVQGKNDFDAIEEFRGDDFFTRALYIGVAPSSSTLRQRMDTNAAPWFERVPAMYPLLLGSLINGQPIVFDSLVGLTYAGVDGYCPFSVQRWGADSN